MCDYCGTDVLPICECGREYVNTPHALAELRAENARLRAGLDHCRFFLLQLEGVHAATSIAVAEEARKAAALAQQVTA